MSILPLKPDFPEETPRKRTQSGLAKLAAVFATIFIVSLGLCGYSAQSSNDYFGGDLGFFSLIAMILSFTCLLAIAVTVIIRALREGYYN